MNRAILFFGGNSDERLVSVATAQNLARQFPFDARWFFTKSGEIFAISSADLLAHENPFKAAFEPRGKKVASSLQEALPLLKEASVFLGFHGTEGESGAIQSIIEQAKIPFAGSDSEASHRCFEKSLAKEFVKKAGLLVAKEITLAPKGATKQLSELQNFLSEKKKIVCKPIANGSSIGLFIVSNEKELLSAVKDIDRLHCTYLVEEFISGRELTVGVLEREGKTFALATTEILINQGRTFDYEGKYLGLGSNEVTPANITAEETKRVMEAAEIAHKSLGCSGYSRTDMILRENGQVVFLETNTLPGLTAASLFPQQLAVQKIQMHDFVELQLELAEMRAGGGLTKKKSKSGPVAIS